MADEVLTPAAEAIVPEEDLDDEILADTANTEMADEVGKEIKITEDGGVVKKILSVGSGWEKPETDDVVTVHYVGTLASDGSQFDSSRDRDEPFTFNLGQGRVIKGWDLGVATMRKGEKALLTITAPYAYGDAGSPPKIPPGATLNFEVELLSWRSVKDLTGDAGVIKTVVAEGDGWEKPNDRDEAIVQYTARVQGAAEPFKTSGSSPNDSVEFVVGQQQGLAGIRGVGTAVQTMRKGERAKLVIKPQYGYGDAGAEGVPPGSTLEVDITLVSWKKVEDVTSDGLVVKKTLVGSEEWKRPNEGAKATLVLTGKLADGSVFQHHPEGNELVVTLDDEALPEGLDLAILKMKKGDRALVSVAPHYGYGDAGAQPGSAEVPQGANLLTPVPPGSHLTYEVHLVDHENAKESYEMSDAEKVEAAAARKDRGNRAYKEGKALRAIKMYDKAVNLISYDKSFSDDLKAKAREVRRAAQLNLAAAHLKLGQHKEAGAAAGKVLEGEPYNVKALYRRAQALIGTGDYVEAEQDIKKGLGEEGGNADLLALHKKLKVLMREQSRKESALYSKMFRFPASKPAAAAVQAAPAANGTEQQPPAEPAPAANGTEAPASEAMAVEAH